MDLSLLTPQQQNSGSVDTISFCSHYQNDHPKKRQCNRGASLSSLMLDGNEQTMPPQLVLEVDFFALPESSSNVLWQENSFLEHYDSTLNYYDPSLQASDTALYTSAPSLFRYILTYDANVAIQSETLDRLQTEIRGTKLCMGMVCQYFKIFMYFQSG